MSVVIVHRSIDLAEEFRDWTLMLNATLPGPIKVAASLAEARSHLAGEAAPLVLVVEAQLPGKEHYSGVALAREMRARWHDLPVCLIVPTDDDPALTNAMTGLQAIAVICEGRDLERDYRHALRRMMAAQLQAVDALDVPRPGRYDVNIRLPADGNCSYEVHASNGAIPHAPFIPFGVDPQRLNALLEDSEHLHDGTDWQGSFERIGAELTKTLLNEQAYVMHDLGILQGLSAACKTTVGLCFTVDRKLYPIAFEALAVPTRGEHRYWLEHSPLWRRLPDLMMNQPSLFSDANGKLQPVNCLLIDAECGGQAVDASGAKMGPPLDPLPGVKPEIEAILDELLTAEPSHIGQVARIEMDRGVVVTTTWQRNGTSSGKMRRHGTFEQVLKELLTTGESWHMVHFAGHSHFVRVGTDEFGYVFVPTGAPNPTDMPRPKPIGIPALASWLKSSRFVYLSACVSSHHDFVFHLCANNVPAMSGFRWRVSDALAREHSARFYRSLFASRSIERALQETWVDMHAGHRNNPVWASSQFVIHNSAA